MSLNLDGFEEKIEGTTISLSVSNSSPLTKLNNALSWESLLTLILPNLKETNRTR
jgi:hypothetical protein